MKLRGKYKKGKRTFADSVKNCLDGINYVLANEKNFVREIILGICAILLSYYLGISRIEWIIVILLINFVFKIFFYIWYRRATLVTTICP